jgi:hypothetical protein
MGLNLSNKQIAKEMDMSVAEVQEMTSQLREGGAERGCQAILRDEVECDEVYIAPGHKDNRRRSSAKGEKGGATG